MMQITFQFIGGPFDGTQMRCRPDEHLVYRPDPLHDLFHVYRRDDESDDFLHAEIIDVPEFRSRWYERT